MKCLIIAAGMGSRLWQTINSKPLIPILGIPLIERVIRLTAQAGLDDFCIVSGYDGERLRPFLDDLAVRRDIKITHVINEEWEKGNGLSVVQAGPHLTDPFVLLMSDHLFDPDSLRTLVQQEIRPGEITLAVDKNITNPLVDLHDVTSVHCENGKVKKIGKRLPEYNAFDTGMFLCTSGLLEGLEDSVKLGDTSLSGGVRCLASKGRVNAFDLGDRIWLDVDDEEGLEKAEWVIQELCPR